MVAVEETTTAGSAGGQSPATTPIGRPRSCAVYETEAKANRIAESLGAAAGSAAAAEPVPPGSMEAGTKYHLECRYRDDGSVAYLDSFVHDPSSSGGPGAAPRAEVLARQVYAEVPLMLPTPRTSPPAGATQLVGLPIWLWLEGGAWRTFEASASVAGVTVTVVAEPATVVWDMGDGTTVACDGPGTPWTEEATGSGGACTHTYRFVSDDQPGGRYRVEATVVWEVSWSASTGQRGSLPDATRTAGFDLDVAQRQAVITYGR